MWRRSTRFLKPIEVSEKVLSCSQLWSLLSCYQYSDVSGNKFKATPVQERRMIDRFRLHVKGGDGGGGCDSARRSRQDRNGKADGGNGGKGGDVLLQCTSSVWDFRGLQHHINGRKGGRGASKNQIGSRGDDKVVLVPVGTVIHLVEGEIPAEMEEEPFSCSDPWEIPGNVDPDASEIDQGSKPSSADFIKLKKADASVESSFSDRRNIKISSSIKQSCQKPSTQQYSRIAHSSWDHKPHVEMLTGCDFESDGGGSRISYYDDQEMDDDVPDGDWNREEEEEIQFNIAELTEEGQRILVARGGEGGMGSVVSGSSSRRAAQLKSKLKQKSLPEESSDESDALGFPGSEAVLILELKTIADVGLVGMPNAGKSTLLGAISRAKPAVGDYAFTTLRPNIGKLNYDDMSVSVADIPGLIKGAHENRGLGHAFLRHIERTKVLAYVVDLAANLRGRKGIPPWEQLRDLISELEHYREGLSTRPSLIVANKIDEVGAEEVYKELRRRVRGVPIFPVCAILEEGVNELKTGLRQLVNGGESSSLGLQSIAID